MGLNENLKRPVSKPGLVVRVVIVGLACIGYAVYFAWTGKLGQWTGHRHDAPPHTAAQPLSNHIAYLDEVGALWIASVDRAKPLRIMPGGHESSLPTWSPNGRQVAFIANDANGNRGVYVSPTDRPELSLVFARDAVRPFYLYWSPSCTELALLSVESDHGLSWPGARPRPEEIVLRSISVTNPADARVLTEGQPMYLAWSPDGSTLLTHVEGVLTLFDRSGAGEPRIIDGETAAFSTPLWSPDGKQIIYARFPAPDKTATGAKTTPEGAETQGGAEPFGFRVVSFDPETMRESQLGFVNGFGLLQMIPSADGQAIACRSSMSGPWNPGHGSFVPLRIFDRRTGTAQELPDLRAYATFWSPDGTKLAVFAPESFGNAPVFPDWQGRRLELSIYDVAAKTLETTLAFAPTESFRSILAHYEQFFLSHAIWSPDSRYVAVSGLEEDGPLVYLVDTTGAEVARKFTAGTLGIWSWH